jgi:hypothetical protein
MRQNSALFSGVTWASLMASIMAQETAKPIVPPTAAKNLDEQTKLKADAKKVVESYFENWKSGKGTENVKLFRSPQVAVTGLMRGPKTEYWQKSAADYMKRFPDKPIEYLPIESIEVEVVNDGLATARVKYKGGGHRDTALFTLSREEDAWQIVSLYVDSHFVW